MPPRPPAVATAAVRALAAVCAAAVGAAWAGPVGAQVPGAVVADAGTERAADTLGTYRTPALRALVASAALGNRVPPTLASYRARVETEFAVAARREGGVEAVVSVEQLASVLRWTRAGYYDQHVVGERARQAGLSLSWLSFVRTGWAAPVLYGNRFRVRRDAEGARRPRRGGAGGGASARRGGGADTLPVVHPLAADRDRYYRYAGGDTVATLRAGGRRLPIVRVVVEPRAEALAAGAALFRGEVDLDAVEHAVVRIRGRVLLADPRPPRGGGPVAAGARALRAVARTVLPRGYAYVEYVNAERTDAAGRRYWLPAYQRVEAQVESPALGGAGAVARIVSRFSELAVNDTALTPAELAADADALLVTARRRLTVAGGDSLGRYGAWREPLGAATAGTHAGDFADLGPRALAPAGPPVADLFVPRASDLVRVDRVDGVFVGAGGRVRLRSRAPGLTLLAAAGAGTASGQVRGRVELVQRLGGGGAAADDPAAPRWALALRAGRSLDLTNDFRPPLDSGSSLGALLGVDDYDYVDRRFAGLALERAGAGRALLARLEAGAASDRGARAALARGPLIPADFRPNRAADAGRYLRTALTVEWHPDVAGEFVRPGLGARLYAERADAALGAPGLRYTRLEGRLTGRRELLAGGAGGALGASTLSIAGRADAGAVLGAGPNGPPPQQLFELGYAQSLLGYGYKTFAGDRAAVARGLAQFTGPFLRAPVRLPGRALRRFVLPGLAPGAAAGVQVGWAEASGAGARASVARLGTRAGAGGAPAPVSRPTDGARASVSLGATLFGGGAFVGAARAVDGHADASRRWRGVVTFGVGL